MIHDWNPADAEVFGGYGQFFTYEQCSKCGWVRVYPKPPSRWHLDPPRGSDPEAGITYRYSNPNDYAFFRWQNEEPNCPQELMKKALK